jgi:hypothetical protein
LAPFNRNRSVILSLYSELHQIGILHNDIQSRHICFLDQEVTNESDGSTTPAKAIEARLIDFEAALRYEPGHEVFEMEMQQVREMLGL